MKTVDSPWYVRGCHPAALAVPTLSLLFVLNRLTPFCNTPCLKILFQLVFRLSQHLGAPTGTTLRGFSPTLLSSFFSSSLNPLWTGKWLWWNSELWNNWGTVARVTLWCVPKAPLPTVPQCLPPKRVRALLSSFPSFSLKLRTKTVKNCSCTGQALKKPN